MATNYASQAIGKIQNGMPVVGSDGVEIGTVDHPDLGGLLKLTKDAQGQHHWIPQAWVTNVDKTVHIDRGSGAATRDWSSTAPA
ncbi:MAG TPA: DUF2171 domain-containing protein [Thermomicrobiales bacterium]|nr:DUF2171 domain-containing protein [Thermomicrobiales bacterium]